MKTQTVSGDIDGEEVPTYFTDEQRNAQCRSCIVGICIQRVEDHGGDSLLVVHECGEA